MSAIDDRGPTYTEAYRHQCEVAYVCDMPGRERRATYLDAVQTRRGEAAGQRLRADVKTEWNRRQQARRAPFPRREEGTAPPGPSVHLRGPDDCTALVPASGSFPPGRHEGPLRRDGCVDSGVSAQ